MASPNNPLMTAGAAATAVDWRAQPEAASFKMSERTRALAERVASAKAQKLTCSEWLCSTGLGALMTLPFLGLTGLTTVPANTTLCVFRFGKLSRVISKPGLYYIAPGYDRISSQMGTQTQKIDNLNVIDRDGNPIIVSALLEYSVVDPAALYIACANNLTVLMNQCEQVVRSACTTLPLLGEKGHDIRSQTQEMAAAMVSELQHDASVLGVAVQRVCIVEARYAQEIAAQMLMKQQASAMVDARKAIVAGALGIVRDALTEFPSLSAEAKEKLINNLLVTLTAHQSPTAVIPLSS